LLLTSLNLLVVNQIHKTESNEMVSERELKQEITHLAEKEEPAAAIEKISRLLRQRAGVGVFVIRPGNGSVAATQSEEVQQFLFSTRSAFRSLHVVELRDRSGAVAGRLVIGFASDEAPGELPRRIAEFAGERVAALVTKSQLGVAA